MTLFSEEWSDESICWMGASPASWDANPGVGVMGPEETLGELGPQPSSNSKKRVKVADETSLRFAGLFI
jgi:hypothetical protein